MNTLADDLRAARGKIAKPGGWAKNLDICPEKGRYCAAVACNDFPRASSMFRLLFEALPEKLKASGSLARVSAVFNFNDDPTTTHNDVLALFDRAIAAAETQEPA